MGRTAPFALAAALTLAHAASASVSPDVLKQTQGAGTQQPAHDPDWPCQQRKVPELSAAAVWSGPSIEPALEHWLEDAEVAALAREAASRRTSLQDAAAAVTEFAKGLPKETKAERLTLLFAGIFATLDSERGEIMGGIERYARKQKAMAEDIRAEQSRLSDLNSAGDTAQAMALTQQLTAEVRVFNERRESLSFVCEVPTLIEQRLYALARAIQAGMAN